MRTGKAWLRGISFLLAMAWIWGLAVVLAGQISAPSVTPSVQQEQDFTFSVYYSGNMRGNLEPCG